jgi:hypothetical protein
VSEWWTYRLSSFLLFSPRTYYRLIELYNAAIWPAQLVALALGLVLGIRVFLVPRRATATTASAAGALAAGWLWVAIAFLARRYATINPAAVWFAWAFALEAALLLAVLLGAAAARIRFDVSSRLARRAGLAVLLLALFGEPLAAPLLGRDLRGAEVFGMTPDPTALATLGILAAMRFRGRWMAMVVPVLWCAVSGATLLAMRSAVWWIAPLAASAIAVVLATERTATTETSAPR